MITTMNRRTGAVLAALVCTCTPVLFRADERAPERAPGGLEGVIQEQLVNDRESAASEHRVEDLDDETRKLLHRYEQLTNETKSLNVYGDELAEQIASQNDEMASTKKQLDEVEGTARDVLPMMQTMVDRLDRLVALDTPFLLDERKKRVEGLKALMKRADVTISEKYRRIAEAYQIELDYGRTIEAYQGQLFGAASPRTVQFLRIGRVALLYQTLDGKETGYWDSKARAWVVDNDYEKAVKEGVSVALKRGAPEMLIAPVPAPREVSS